MHNNVGCNQIYQVCKSTIDVLLPLHCFVVVWLRGKTEQNGIDDWLISPQ